MNGNYRRSLMAAMIVVMVVVGAWVRMQPTDGGQPHVKLAVLSDTPAVSGPTSTREPWPTARLIVPGRHLGGAPTAVLVTPSRADDFPYPPPSPVRSVAAAGEPCEEQVPWVHFTWDQLPNGAQSALLEAAGGAQSVVFGIVVIVANRYYVAGAHVIDAQGLPRRVYWGVRDSGANVPSSAQIEVFSAEPTDGSLRDALQQAEACVDRIQQSRR